MHLVIDGFGGNTSKMWDEQQVRQFLTDYPESLAMTRITEPRVLVYEAPKPEDSGVTGFVIIAESHISIHTFPRKSYVNIDIFSCRAFDHDRALADVKRLFDPGGYPVVAAGPGAGVAGRGAGAGGIGGAAGGSGGRRAGRAPWLTAAPAPGCRGFTPAFWL